MLNSLGKHMSFFLLMLGDAREIERADEPESFEALYALYYRPVAHYLAQLCGSVDQADELAQETFVRAYTSLLSFRRECTAATWLFRIARNTYLNSLRGRHAAVLAAEDWHAIPDATGYGDPVRYVATVEQREAIKEALAQIPEQQRSILLLRDGAGLAYVEIADVLGISVAAVRMKLFRARNTFRQSYRGRDGGGDDDGKL